MAGVILMPYDGLLGLIFQPLLGMIASALGVGRSLGVGLLLMAPGLRGLWNVRSAGALGLLAAGMLLFGHALGLRGTFVDPENGTHFEGLPSGAALGSWFVLVIAIANWPLRSRDPKAAAS